MLESVELLLKAIDKAIQLFTVRVESKRRVFKEIVEPLFRDLEPVVENYFLIFNGSIEVVKAAKPGELQEAVAKIKALREQMLVARVKVQQLADTIASTSKDKQLLEFSNRVLALFYCTRHSSSKASRSTVFVELLDDLLVSDLGLVKGHLVDSIQRTKDEIAHAWLRVSQTYAGLRLESVK